MPEQDPTTKQEFQEAMDDLILRALENGVPIDDGGYELRHDAKTRDLEVMIFRLKKSG
ncbi:hypothetical protein ACFSBX_16665 [Halobellus rarus]|uniref:Amphi-Trp domain-containing protein n=1 Tax=Halobellus rarus TaxID=1126237 RepID=A0ABD6CQX2_9EURY